MTGTLQTPAVGSLNSTEDPKIATAISTLNGLLDSSNKVDITLIAANTITQSQVATSFITSGVYTPTLTNTTNIAASTANEMHYLRVGSTVAVSGKVSIDPTAAGAVVLGMTLPIASNIGTDADLGGVAATPQSAPLSEVLSIEGDSTNDRATIQGDIGDTTNNAWFCVFMYQVI